MATVHETYAAALQHGRDRLPERTRLVGVVRRPMAWFHGAVDENRRALGPPEGLLDEVKERQTELEAEGLTDRTAIREAWEDVEFASRYRGYLDADGDAQSAMAALLDRVREGEDVALVCYEAPDKPCHRHLLRDRLLERLDGG